jgi:hypothetical protein
MIVISSTLTSSGSAAMCVTTRATCWTSNVGSCASVPAGCSALIRGVSVSAFVEPERESESESAVAAFPAPRVSACGGEEDGGRHTDVDLRACDVVRAALERGRAREAGDRVLGRRVRHPVRARDVRRQRAVVDDPPCAPVSPRAPMHTLHTAAPPGGDWALNARMAARVKRKEPVRFVSITVRKDSSVVSSIGTCGADTPAFCVRRQPLHAPQSGGAR